MRLVLFDIDGTLLLTNGAGTRALNRAFLELFNLQEGMRSVRPDGKTDPLIVREALRVNGGLPHLDSGQMDEFFRCYERFFAQEMRSSGLQVFWGAVRLARLLADDPRFRVGLATGNIESCAWAKLQHAGIDGLFSFGAFGSDAEDRTEVIRTAIRRGADGKPDRVESAVVIGDTPLDVEHGQRAGARTIAVATGNYPLQDLQASRPGLAVETLQPSPELLAYLEV